MLNALTATTPVHWSCQETLVRVKQSLLDQGLRVLETFDLQKARLGVADCPCPSHGTANCDCQMVVLLVYGKAGTPTALTLHGNESETWLSLVNDPGVQADAAVATAIEEALRANPT